MNEDEEMVELSPDNYPKAAEILTESFYWDCADEFSPFGNDDGADVFWFFRDWREEHPVENPIKFVDEQLKEWEVVNDYWDVTDDEQTQKLIREDDFSFCTRDNTMVAVAFGQILLDGKVHPDVRKRALLAIERQLLPSIVAATFGPGNECERIEKLRKMRAVLNEQ